MVLYVQQIARELLSEHIISARECARRMAALFPAIWRPGLLSNWWRLDEAYDCDYSRMECSLIQHHLRLRSRKQRGIWRQPIGEPPSYKRSLVG